MLQNDQLIQKIHPPIHTDKTNYNIGIIGGGNIVENVHLPAYKKAGFSVTGLYDLNIERANDLSSQFSLDKTYGHYMELIEDPNVDIIDIAIPNKGRGEIIKAACAAKKHILVQKPLSLTVEEGKQFIEMAGTAGVTLAVNQNARWSGMYRGIQVLLESGAIGTPYYATHQLYSTFDWMTHHNRWHFDADRYQLIQYGVHHFDLLNVWLGQTPEWVFANITRRKNQAFKGDMLDTVLFHYNDNLQAALLETNNLYIKRPASTHYEIHGTEGCLVKTGENEITLFNEKTNENGLAYDLSGAPWFPDGFIYTMYELMEAIHDGTTAKNEAVNVLPAIDMAEKAYESAERGEKIHF